MARMKYPYTLAGKLLHFPWKHYWQHGRAIRFTAYSLILCVPVFSKISGMGEDVG